MILDYFAAVLLAIIAFSAFALERDLACLEESNLTRWGKFATRLRLAVLCYGVIGVSIYLCGLCLQGDRGIRFVDLLFKVPIALIAAAHLYYRPFRVIYQEKKANAGSDYTVFKYKGCEPVYPGQLVAHLHGSGPLVTSGNPISSDGQATD